MKAIISANDKRIDDDFAAFKQAGIAVRPGEPVRFTQTSSIPYFPFGDEIGSIFWPQPSAMFDEVFIGPSVKLLPGAWERAFLRNAARMTSPTGVLRRIDGTIDISTRREQESVLDWWYEAVHEILVAALAVRANPDFQHWVRSDDLFLEFLYDTAERIVGGARKKLRDKTFWNAKSPIDLEPELKRALSTQAYYISGIGYKAPILKSIIEDYIGNRPFRYVDFGGGYGLLAAELCLTMPQLAEAIVRDPSTSNLVFAEQLYRGLRNRLQRRFFFSLGIADDFAFEGKFDVISFFGSFLYVAPERQKAVLQECWNSLNSGGIIVLHENIKNPSFKADFDKMFTVDQIDEMMGQFGEVQRYLFTAQKRITRDLAGEKTILRVIQKT